MIESDTYGYDDADDSVNEQDLYAYIVRYLVGEDHDRRIDALNLIRYLECDPRLAELLLTLARHDNAEWRLIGIQALGAWRHSDGVALLIEMFERPMDADMEEAAILSIGQIGGIDAFQFLCDYAGRRYHDHVEQADPLGMAALEGIAQIAQHGHAEAVQFLLQSCHHAAWNMREASADCLGIIYGGKESIPRIVYDTLVTLSKDDNKDVRIAAYMSLDAIVGLDEENKKKLHDARQKQIFG